MKDAHGEKQHKQPVADADERGVDGRDRAPYLPAAKLLRRLRDEQPQLRELFVPCVNGGFKRTYDPVIADV